MDTLEKLLGIDPEDPQTKLAAELAAEHYSFLERLVQERVNAGLSQREVASRMGVTQPTVSSIERLGSDLKLSTVRRYALAVGAMVKYQVEPAEEGSGETSGVVVSLENHRQSRMRMNGTWPSNEVEWMRL